MPSSTSPLVEDDPFRFGWRYVKRLQPDGSETYDTVPLREEDLLYPEEEDFVIQKPPHQRDAHYLFGTLKAFYARQPSVVVLGDCRVDWGPAGSRPTQKNQFKSGSHPHAAPLALSLPPS